MNTMTSRAAGERGAPLARLLRRALAAAALALVAAPLGADTNRLLNPDFDTDVTGWDDPLGMGAIGPLWDVEDRNGCAGSGSAFLSGGPTFGGYIAAMGQPVPVSGGDALFVGGEARVTLATASTEGRVMVRFCAASCGDWLVSPTVDLPFGAWGPLWMPPLVVPSYAHWAYIGFAFRSAAAFDVLVDRASAGARDEIFAEGFEAGALCRWSGYAGSVP